MALKLTHPIRSDYLLARPAFSIFCPADGMDSFNRPVYEVRGVICKATSIDYDVCPYDDSRKRDSTPFEMNISALKVFLSNRTAVEAEVGRLRGLTARRGLSPIQRLFAYSYAAYRLPNFQLASKATAMGLPIISGEVSTASKIAEGILQCVYHIAQSESEVLSEKWTADSVYSYANSAGLLANAGACAAPRRMIIDYIKLILQPEDGHALRMDFLLETAYLSYAMERLALVYETLRCTTWKAFRNCRAGKCPPPPARHAVPHCSIAAEAAASEDPVGHLRLRAILSFHDSYSCLAYHSLDHSILHLLAGARELGRSLSAGIPGCFIAWTRFQDDWLSVAKSVNSELERSIGNKEFGFSELSVADLKIFFGNSPTDDHPTNGSSLASEAL